MGRVYLVIDIFINGVKWANLVIRALELIRVDLAGLVLWQVYWAIQRVNYSLLLFLANKICYFVLNKVLNFFPKEIVNLTNYLESSS